MNFTRSVRYRNAMIGLAAGDAWGYQVEFKKYNQMPHPVPEPAKIWKISDDTQMTIAVEDAMIRSDELGFVKFFNIDAISETLLEAFDTWSTSSDNDRAPGATCMGSISRQMKNGTRWHDENGALESAGCGAVMRALPTIAESSQNWRGLTVLQAFVTHKDPMAAASALLLGEAARMIVRGETYIIEELLGIVNDMANGHYAIDERLASVLSLVTDDGRNYLAEGASGLLADSMTKATEWWIEEPPIFDIDICEIAGQGWDAATATVLAILVAQSYLAGELTGHEALEWAATSNGDSDSIAAIAGLLIGLSSNNAEFWAAEGVDPTFERKYNNRIFLGARFGGTYL